MFYLLLRGCVCELWTTMFSWKKSINNIEQKKLHFPASLQYKDFIKVVFSLLSLFWHPPFGQIAQPCIDAWTCLLVSWSLYQEKETGASWEAQSTYEVQATSYNLQEPSHHPSTCLMWKDTLSLWTYTCNFYTQQQLCLFVVLHVLGMNVFFCHSDKA